MSINSGCDCNSEVSCCNHVDTGVNLSTDKTRENIYLECRKCSELVVTLHVDDVDDYKWNELSKRVTVLCHKKRVTKPTKKTSVIQVSMGNYRGKAKPPEM
ncbi:MAG TPA: hypothetical protein ENI23_17400 [bacterium]|nr:hypothetical protein [bacterium]